MTVPITTFTNGYKCRLIGIFNQFLSNYSRDSEQGREDDLFNNTQRGQQLVAIVSAATAIVTTSSDNNKYSARATTNASTTIKIKTKNDKCDNGDKLCINGIFQGILKCDILDILSEYLSIVIGLSFLSIILFVVFHILIFYECIFHHNNGTIGLIIHDSDEYYFYIYQLLKLFTFIAIYGAFFIVLFEYGTISFTFAGLATILELHTKSQQRELQYGKQIETATMLLITTRKNDKNIITTTERQFLFDLNNVYLIFRMAIILVFILVGIFPQTITIMAYQKVQQYIRIDQFMMIVMRTYVY